MSGGRLRVASLAAAFCVPCIALSADAQVFPNRTLRIIAGFAPGGSTDIIARLNGEITKALRLPDMRERLLRDGAEPVASTAEEFRAYIEADVEKWAKVIQRAGIRFEP